MDQLLCPFPGEKSNCWERILLQLLFLWVKKNILFSIWQQARLQSQKSTRQGKNNEWIPSDWALDKNGEPTTDPIEAINGLILPIEGHKGYGLAMTIDILAGVLSGAASLSNVGKFYSQDAACMNVGQTFIAINPLLIYGDQFENIMSGYVDTIYNSKTIDSQTIRIPGMHKLSTRKENIKSGIYMDKSVVESIKGLL